MGQALYRKYRSKNLGEIVGQKPITTALTNALKSGQISHAYLFTGPRGVGKTSVARILAHEINQLPYVNDELPIDIIEIDAASNRRIDEIRDLREKVHIAPVSAKYKVYIIDEVHMLTREAFNALLKTLEEPPAHVIFILATTEAHKLPETIVSRTQRYTFKPASTQEVADHLSAIAKKEKITIDDESLQLLAKHSDGSLRDALSLLDQVRHEGKVSAASVRRNLGIPSQTTVTNLINAIIQNNPKDTLAILEQAQTDGILATTVAQQLIKELRGELIKDKAALTPQQILPLMQDLLAVESSAHPDVQLELALIKSQLSADQPSVSAANSQTLDPPLTISQPVKRKSKPEPIQSTTTAESIKMTPEHWPDLLEQLRTKHNTQYGILRMAEPCFDNLDDGQLILKFNFPFHQRRMSEPKNKKIILDAFAAMDITGYEIICEVLPKNASAKASAPTVPKTPQLNELRDVFGSVEVLE